MGEGSRDTWVTPAAWSVGQVSLKLKKQKEIDVKMFTAYFNKEREQI